ncbi:hypothetical protein FY534_14080 (plasmid) [Alicyclobacillus sp. TC]|uniref:ParB/RepB/Spo0J family partition protein n=1 Tax=Alicyclobacillus sp. TC TaxID=2606450 RepID=UPI0019316C90|nr:hypothetical protein [Alicyclobacillus sp. TC]QRF24900.1 hypothetical protein FY534_14080 [Alicyclobacillus sp. TC]
MLADVAWINPHQLTPHPERARVGTILKKTDGKYQLLRDSIAANGIEVPLKVQAGTNIILAGHTRQRIAIELDMQMVPVQYMDVDDETAEFTMVIDNHLRAGDEKDPIKMAETFKAIVDLIGYSRGGHRNRKVDVEDIHLSMVTSDTSIEGSSNGPNVSLIGLIRKRTLKEISGYYGMTERNFYRYLELLKLIPELKEMVSQEKIGLKAGTILAKLPEEQQKKLYDSIPVAQRMKSEYRLGEKEAINLAEIYAIDKKPTTSVAMPMQSDVIKKTLKIEEEQDSQGSNDELWMYGKSNDKISVGAAALHYISDEHRRDYLEAANAVDEAHGKNSTEERKKIEDATQEIAEKIVLMEDESTRIAYGNRQLESSCKEALADIQRHEVRLIANRSVVGKNLDMKVIESWDRVMSEIKRLYEKMEQMRNLDGDVHA